MNTFLLWLLLAIPAPVDTVDMVYYSVTMNVTELKQGEFFCSAFVFFKGKPFKSLTVTMEVAAVLEADAYDFCNRSLKIFINQDPQKFRQYFYD